MAPMGQLEHSCYVDPLDLSQRVRLRTALPSLEPHRSTSCPRCPAGGIGLQGKRKITPERRLLHTGGGALEVCIHIYSLLGFFPPPRGGGKSRSGLILVLKMKTLAFHVIHMCAFSSSDGCRRFWTRRSLRKGHLLSRMGGCCHLLARIPHSHGGKAPRRLFLAARH